MSGFTDHQKKSSFHLYKCGTLWLLCSNSVNNCPSSSDKSVPQATVSYQQGSTWDKTRKWNSITI